MSAAESYASLDDFRSCGLPAPALANLETPQVLAALLRASRLADTFMRDRYTLPLRCPFDPSLTLWVCWLAAWSLLSTRGFNPNQAGFDTVVRMNYDDAIKGLIRVATGQQQLDLRQATPPTEEPILGTEPPRGYGALPIVGPNTWGQ